MGPTNSLHASVQYSKNNKTFDLKKIKSNNIFSKLRQSGLFLSYCVCEQLSSFENMLQLRQNVGNCVKSMGRKLTLTPASWSSGNALVSGAGGLRFNYWSGIIRHNVANDSPPLGHIFEKSCVGRAQWHRDGPGKLVTRFGAIHRV